MVFDWLKRVMRLEEYPQNKKVWVDKGAYFGDLGRYEEAIKCFDKALEIDPEDKYAWYNKATALTELGRHAKAIKCFDNVLEFDPKYKYAWRKKGVAFAKIGKYEEAIKCFDEILKIDPKDEEALHDKGIALNYRGITSSKSGNYEEAIKYYDKALVTYPKNKDSWRNKGSVLAKLSKYEEAINCYDKALEIDPNDKEARRNKGMALVNKGSALGGEGKYKEAIKCFDMALKIDPNNNVAWRNKGVALHEISDFEEAEKGTNKSRKRMNAMNHMRKNTKEVIKPTILFLRPFWDADVTAEQLKIIHKTTRCFGKLTAFRNVPEQIKQLFDDENLRLIEAPDEAPVETWQERCIEEIQKADMIIVHLAPKSPDLQEFTVMQPEQTPSSEFDFGHNPVHEAITGHGLLRELDYCKQEKALQKTIVLIPNSFLHRVFEVLEIGDITQPGQWYRKTNAGLVALTPKLSTLDRALTVLHDVRSVIPYDNFGDRLFSIHLHQELSRCIESLPQHDLSTSPLSQVNIDTGIPPEPVKLPPDGELKHIRCTPIYKLTKIPRGKIVELSFDEVEKLKPDLASELESSELKCPGCGKGLECMFWYQYGLVPGSSGIYMRCQYCGHDDHV